MDDTFKTDLTEIVSRTRWGRFCGDTLPPTLYSTRNRLQVFFTTNSSQQVANNNRASEPNHGKEGFYVTYEVVEQGEMRGHHKGHRMVDYEYLNFILDLNVRFIDCLPFCKPNRISLYFAVYNCCIVLAGRGGT